MSGCPLQQTCRLRQITRSVAAITRCRSCETSSTPQPRLADDIDALDRLVQHQELRLAQQRARQQHALQLAAREGLQRQVERMACADLGQRCRQRLPPRPGDQRQEAAHRQRQRLVDGEALRHIADAQARPAAHQAGIRPLQPQRDAQQRRLAGAVGADDGDDLAGAKGERDVAQRDVRTESDMETGQLDQRRWRGGHRLPRTHCWQRGHRPRTSMVWRSTAKPSSPARRSTAAAIVGSSSSAAALHAPQIRNWLTCGRSGRAQPT